jgi:hypothetical protein
LAPTVEGNEPISTVIPATAVTVEALAPTFAVASMPAAVVTTEALMPTIIGELPAAAIAVDGQQAIAKTPATWSIVGVSTFASITTSTELGTGIPAGTQQGDLLVAFVAARSNPTFTPPAGWTLATSQSNGNISETASEGIASGALAWIVRGATTPATVWTLSASNVAMSRCTAYRPSSGTPEFIGSSSQTAAAASTTASTGSIEVDSAWALVVAAFCGGCDTSPVSDFVAATDPSTASDNITNNTTTAPTVGVWIKRADSQTLFGADTTLAVADAVKTEPGPTGAIQATAGVSSRHVMVAAAFGAR